MAGNHISEATFDIGGKISQLDHEPSLGQIHYMAQRYRNEGGYRDDERVFAYVELPSEGEETHMIKCGDRPYDKIRPYVSEKTESQTISRKRHDIG